METSPEFEDTEMKHVWNDTVVFGQNSTMDNSYDFLDTNFKQVIDHVQGVFCMFGSVLNLISIFILSRPDMDTVFNRLLTALALFDFGYVFSYGVMEFGVLSDVEGWKEGKGAGFNAVVLMILHTICLFSYKASSFVTMAASIERYVAVTYPIKSKEYNVDVAARRRMSCLYIVPVVLLSIATIVPGLYWYETAQLNYVLQIDLQRKQNRAYCLFLFILLHDIVLLTLNYKIYKVIKRASDKKSSMILFLIVALSFVSHIFCYAMAVAKWPISTASPPMWYKYVSEICVLFAVFNCSVNFFIYNYAANKFRLIFFQYFCCKSNESEEPSSMSWSKDTVMSGSKDTVIERFRSLTDVFSASGGYDMGQVDHTGQKYDMGQVDHTGQKYDMGQDVKWEYK